MKDTLVVVGIVVALILGFVGLSQPTLNLDSVKELVQSFGATPGSDFFNPVQLFAGVKYASVIATTTPVSMTMRLADFDNRDVIQMLPQNGSVTITLPATSTMASYLASGEKKQFCIYNATSTASQTITLAEGTGWDIENIATTTTAGSSGILPIAPLDVGCLTVIKKSNTDLLGIYQTHRDI